MDAVTTAIIVVEYSLIGGFVGSLLARGIGALRHRHKDKVTGITEAVSPAIRDAGYRAMTDRNLRELFDQQSAEFIKYPATNAHHQDSIEAMGREILRRAAVQEAARNMAAEIGTGR